MNIQTNRSFWDEIAAQPCDLQLSPACARRTFRQSPSVLSLGYEISVVIDMVAVEPWTRSRGNGLILVLIAPVPSFLYHFLELIFCREAGLGLQRSTFCACTKLHPLFQINLLIFVNICIVFWLVSLYQQSTWVSYDENAHPIPVLSPPSHSPLGYLTHKTLSISFLLIALCQVGSALDLFPCKHRRTAFSCNACS